MQATLFDATSRKEPVRASELAEQVFGHCDGFEDEPSFYKRKYLEWYLRDCHNGLWTYVLLKRKQNTGKACSCTRRPFSLCDNILCGRSTCPGYDGLCCTCGIDEVRQEEIQFEREQGLVNVNCPF